MNRRGLLMTALAAIGSGVVLALAWLVSPSLALLAAMVVGAWLTVFSLVRSGRPFAWQGGAVLVAAMLGAVAVQWLAQTGVCAAASANLAGQCTTDAITSATRWSALMLLLTGAICWGWLLWVRRKG